MMTLIFLIIKLILAPLAFCLPIGHESGLLGNTTSRPGDIGSILNFPSALAFDDDDTTRLYAGLMYYQLRINGNDSVQSSTDNSFVPYFTATTFRFGKYKVTTYGQYADDKRTKVQVHLESSNTEGVIDITGHELQFGASLARKINGNLSVGLNNEIALKSEDQITYISGVIDGRDYLSIYSSKMDFVILTEKLALSWQNGQHFFSWAIKSPSIILNRVGKENSRTLVAGENIEAQQSDFKPYIRESWRLSAGYSWDLYYFHPTIEVNYHLADSYTEVRSELSPSRTNVKKSKGYFNIAAGAEVRISQQSIMLGTNWSQSQAAQGGQEYGEDFFSASLGVKLKSLESHPIIGIYFEQEKNSTGLGTNLVGIMYSTNYNL